jgi:glycosyltransferase involved in cell wall biosynthesis
VLTVHSTEGLKVARELFPFQRSIVMPYGINIDNLRIRDRSPSDRPIRILSAGSDRHRDWTTLLAAVRDCPDTELRIVTHRLPAGLTLGNNAEVVHPKTNDEYIALYAWAHVVAIAVLPNLHGSGITVIEEATVLGVPVVVSDLGGLRGYFSEQEVRYVPAANPVAMRQAILTAADDPGSAKMVERAQRHMIQTGLTSRSFAQRHAALSRELLRGKTPAD